MTQINEFGEYCQKTRGKNGSARYAFTINNYSDDDYLIFRHLPDEFRYVLAGQEVAETGTPHLQCYVEFEKKKSTKQANKLIHALWPTAAQISWCRKDSLANRQYCIGNVKKKNYVVNEFSEAGKRTLNQRERRMTIEERNEADLEAAKEGKFEDVSAAVQLRYFSNLNAINMYYANPQVPAIKSRCGIYVHSDGTKTGKSRALYFLEHRLNIPVYEKDNGKFWDNYVGQPIVTMEEFDPSFFAEFLRGYAALKQWTDRNPFAAEFKHSRIKNKIRPHVFIITSNFPFREIFQHRPDYESLRDRFIIYDTTGYDPEMTYQRILEGVHNIITGHPGITEGEIIPDLEQHLSQSFGTTINFDVK